MLNSSEHPSPERHFLDVVHGKISFSRTQPLDCLVWALIDTTAFQRLRRIRQLGFSFYTFYGAESSRFVHSIGVFAVARQMLAALIPQAALTVAPWREAVLLAALLHDLGHGPFSHASETAFGFSHEQLGLLYLTDPDSQIHQLIEDYRPGLSALVVRVLTATDCPPWVAMLVSGQLDCDRCDYLLRDSLQTGVTYGQYQLDRIIGGLSLAGPADRAVLAVSESAQLAVEDYLFARYSMYRQVYHHRKTLAADALLKALVRRLRELRVAGTEPLLLQPTIMQGWLDLPVRSLARSDHQALDDYQLWAQLTALADPANQPDRILSYLARCLVERQLYRTVNDSSSPPDPSWLADYAILSESRDYLQLSQKQQPKQPWQQTIYILTRTGELKTIEECSPLAATLMKSASPNNTPWRYQAPIPKNKPYY